MEIIKNQRNCDGELKTHLYSLLSGIHSVSKLHQNISLEHHLIFIENIMKQKFDEAKQEFPPQIYDMDAWADYTEEVETWKKKWLGDSS